jgi:D(-)-tartrate dehydratase
VGCRVRIAAYHGHAGQSCALLRADDMHDPLPRIVHAKMGEAVIRAVLIQHLDLQVALRNEKPGGHGDRAAAVGAVELAFWDLNAKLNDEPAHVTIARHFGRSVEPRGVSVYAAGGYYYPEEGVNRLREEFRGYQEMGFSAFKMKIAGAPLQEDLARIEAVLEVAGDGAKLAVDANGRFDLKTALEYAKAITPYKLRWFEEIGDPLDFDLNRRVIEAYEGPVATGENLFSAPDVKNLVLFGGMRPSHDVFQMDAGLSYGLVEYSRMLSVLEANGFDRRFAHPHGGHLINLHIANQVGHPEKHAKKGHEAKVGKGKSLP